MRLALVAALALLVMSGLAACSGSDTESSTPDESTQPTEPPPTIELFPIPSPTVEPTATETPDPDDEAGNDSSDDDEGADEAGDTDADSDGPDASGVSEEDSDELDDGVSMSTVWTHVDGFDLGFSNGRTLLPESVDVFYTVGDGDIAESVDSILSSIDHPLTWQDAADAALQTFPDGLGDSAGIFTLLSTQWAVIGCESHLAGMSRPSWNRLLFDHLVDDAAGLPAEQADNQAGVLLNGTNAAIDLLCPRLVRGV